MKKTSLILLVLIASSWCARAQNAPNLRVKEPDLRRELLKLAEKDQAIRNELISHGMKNPDRAILARMEAIDAANTERMQAIVNQYGWPGPELFPA